MVSRQQIEMELRMIAANERIAQLRPRWLMVPHERGQRQMLASRHKIRVAIPGNGFGKTTAMGMAMDMLLQRDDPYNPDMVPTKWAPQGIWVCQKFQQMDLLRAQLEDEIWTRPWSWNQSRHFYEWPNGSKLFIVSGDSNWEHIQGIPVDAVAFDEHPDRALWNELMFRRRGKRKTRYMVAATMTQGMTWFVREVVQKWEEFHKAQGLSSDEARDLQLHPSIWLWDKGGIADNPSMSEEDLAHYQEIGHASTKELDVRLRGGYADFAGESVFDRDAMDLQLKNLTPPESGTLVLSNRFEPRIIVPDGYDQEEMVLNRGGRHHDNYAVWHKDMEIEGGYIHLWEMPNASCTYVMGADFAAGLVGRDYDAVVVAKKRGDGQLEQVAEARGWWGDAEFARVLYLLGMFYFNAFLVGERQFGLPALRRLYDEYGYGYIFRGRTEANRSRRMSDMLGHHRSQGDTIIPNLRTAMKRGDIVVRSTELLTEMRQYQFVPRHAGVDAEYASSQQLVTSAPKGMNDDLVMAMAYCWHAAREVGRYRLPPADYSPGTFGHLFQNGRVLRGQKRITRDSL